MKIITQLVILTLSLLLVNATDNQYCSNLFKQYQLFKNKCDPTTVTIDNCCDLIGFTISSNKKSSTVYQMKSCVAPCEETPSFSKVTFHAYCDMYTAGGGWIVIQRNKKDSPVNFYRKWADYEKGFGDLKTEFWYGLEEIHCLTQRGQWEMRVDYQKSDKTWSYLHYNQFSVGSASKEYPLTIGGFTGTGSTDSFAAHQLNGTRFSTFDNDNDKTSSRNCAILDKAGWWQNNCNLINLNMQPPHMYHFGTIIFAEMKIRPKNCVI